jgi:hypothetical protein
MLLYQGFGRWGEKEKRLECVRAAGTVWIESDGNVLVAGEICCVSVAGELEFDPALGAVRLGSGRVVGRGLRMSQIGQKWSLRQFSGLPVSGRSA